MLGHEMLCCCLEFVFAVHCSCVWQGLFLLVTWLCTLFSLFNEWLWVHAFLFGSLSRYSSRFFHSLARLQNSFIGSISATLVPTCDARARVETLVGQRNLQRFMFFVLVSRVAEEIQESEFVLAKLFLHRTDVSGPSEQRCAPESKCLTHFNGWFGCVQALSKIMQRGFLDCVELSL